MNRKKILYSLIGVLLLAGISGLYVITSPIFHFQSSTESSASLEPRDPEPPAPESPMISPPTVYEIKGRSSKLSSQEIASMQKWRKEIAEIAKANSDWVYLNGSTTSQHVALTFDDGPDSSVTPKILDILNHYHVKGNFFFTGQNAKANPGVVKRAYREGHLVLSHSFSHPQFTQKSEAFITRELEQTDNIIKTLTGYTPEFVRPPYGIVTDQVLKVAKAQNKKLIIWSTDTLDWSQKEKENIIQNVLLNVRPGEIILMHCNSDKQATAEALPALIEGLQAKGYQIATLKELL